MNKHNIKLAIGTACVVFSSLLCAAEKPVAGKPVLKAVPIEGIQARKIEVDTAKKQMPQLKPGVRRDLKLKPNPLGKPKLKPVNLAQGCPDPAVTDFSMVHPRRARDGSWVFFLSVTVKNIGGRDFDSRRGQQSVQLYEVHPGGRSTLLKSTDFGAVGAGQTVGYELGKTITDWRTSHEFPPEYRVQISYGPDIYIDGNEANDDCRKGNNKKRIRGSEVNQLIARMAAR